ncbi:MAG: galactokinase family protein [Sulfitobacter sp.]|nr:galactokinase family protein [Sulfitobacter sp.]
MQLHDWLDSDRIVELLESQGLSPAGARSKASLFARAADQLLGDGAPRSQDTVGCFCPGRLEVLGKHTDYAGGRSLIAAPELGVAMILCQGKPGRIRAISAQDLEACDFPIDGGDSAPTLGWGLYPATVLRRLARNFPEVELGAHLACASDLPLAAGMSSSSALMTATFLCLTKLAGIDQNPLFREVIANRPDLAMFISCVENGQSFGPFDGHLGVGTFGGSEDHTAMLCGKAGFLSQYSYAPISLERHLALPSGHTFLVAQSGVTAEKSAGAREAYNRLSLMVRELTDLAQGLLGDNPRPSVSLAAYLGADAEHGERLAHAIRQGGRALQHDPADLLKRLQHFRLESEQLIPQWPDRWDAHAPRLVGDLALRSTRAAQDLLGNQVRETMWLTEALLEAGAIAASPFGAGFGGSVWALIGEDRFPDLIETLRGCNAPTPPLQAALKEVQTVALGPGAIVL